MQKKALKSINQIIGNDVSIFVRSWPESDQDYLREETIEIPVLVNGRVRDRIVINASWPESLVKEAALASEKIKKNFTETPPKKVIYVDKKIVNIVL